MLRSLKKGAVTSFNCLGEFLMAGVGAGGRADPAAIPKTIVFIDSVSRIGAARKWASHVLVHMTKDAVDPADRYVLAKGSPGTGTCVLDILREFSSYTSDFDKDVTYDMFIEVGSVARIVFATTSLGMGINIPDVKRVVVIGFPIGWDLGDT